MTSPSERDLVAGVIVSGGSGVRLGGVDKAELRVAGSTLMQRALDALAGCAELVVVGPPGTDTAAPIVPLPEGVLRASEAPPGGGPAAGLLAGIARLSRRETWVAALAVDMPFVTAETFTRLVAAAAHDGAVLVDANGRRQFLCAVYRRSALIAAGEAGGDPHGMPMSRLVAGLDLAEVREVGHESLDIDRPEDLEHVDEDARPIAFRDR